MYRCCCRVSPVKRLNGSNEDIPVPTYYSLLLCIVSLLHLYSNVKGNSVPLPSISVCHGSGKIGVEYGASGMVCTTISAGHGVLTCGEKYLVYGRLFKG